MTTMGTKKDIKITTIVSTNNIEGKNVGQMWTFKIYNS
jgi:hypothetical protein